MRAADIDDEVLVATDSDPVQAAVSGRQAWRERGVDSYMKAADHRARDGVGNQQPALLATQVTDD